MDLFVGRLAPEVNSSDLKRLFETYGKVLYTKVVIDRDTGISKGVGFVKMANDDEARAAIDKTHGKEFMGRYLNVLEAEERSPKNNG